MKSSTSHGTSSGVLEDRHRIGDALARDRDRRVLRAVLRLRARLDAIGDERDRAACVASLDEQLRVDRFDRLVACVSSSSDRRPARRASGSPAPRRSAPAGTRDTSLATSPSDGRAARLSQTYGARRREIEARRFGPARDPRRSRRSRWRCRTRAARSAPGLHRRRDRQPHLADLHEAGRRADDRGPTRIGLGSRAGSRTLSARLRQRQRDAGRSRVRAARAMCAAARRIGARGRARSPCRCDRESGRCSRRRASLRSSTGSVRSNASPGPAAPALRPAVRVRRANRARARRDRSAASACGEFRPERDDGGASPAARPVRRRRASTRSPRRWRSSACAARGRGDAPASSSCSAFVARAASRRRHRALHATEAMPRRSRSTTSAVTTADDDVDAFAAQEAPRSALRCAGTVMPVMLHSRGRRAASSTPAATVPSSSAPDDDRAPSRAAERRAHGGDEALPRLERCEVDDAGVGQLADECVVTADEDRRTRHGSAFGSSCRAPQSAASAPWFRSRGGRRCWWRLRRQRPWARRRR